MDPIGGTWSASYYSGVFCQALVHPQCTRIDRLEAEQYFGNSPMTASHEQAGLHLATTNKSLGNVIVFTSRVRIRSSHRTHISQFFNITSEAPWPRKEKEKL
jgi:hypothetical protein